MRMKLSKAQWREIGKRAGWVRHAQMIGGLERNIKTPETPIMNVCSSKLKEFSNKMQDFSSESYFVYNNTFWKDPQFDDETTIQWWLDFEERTIYTEEDDPSWDDIFMDFNIHITGDDGIDRKYDHWMLYDPENGQYVLKNDSDDVIWTGTEYGDLKLTLTSIYNEKVLEIIGESV